MKRLELCTCIVLAMLLVYGCDLSSSPEGEQGAGESTASAVSQNASENFEETIGEGSQTDFSNLDRSETIITEHQPISGGWNLLTVDAPYISDATVEAVQEVVEGFGKAFSYDNVTCKLWWYNGTAYSSADILYQDMTAEDYELAEYMRYVSDDFYMDLGIGGMIELYQPESVKRILGDEITESWSWRPFYVADEVAEYDLAKEPDSLSQTYALDGSQVSLGEAVENALEYLKTTAVPHIFSAAYDYQPARIEVYQFHEDQYGYLIRYEMLYDGVPIMTNREQASNDMYTQEGKAITGSVVSNAYRLATLSASTVDWIWDSALAYEDPTVTKIETELLTYEEACRTASDLLSPSNVFKLEDAELLYVMVQEYDSESERWLGAKVRPAWSLTISNLHDGEHRYMYLYVAADTGEVYIQYE